MVRRKKKQFIEGGYVKLWRAVMNSKVWGDAYLYKLFMFCIMNASYKKWNSNPPGARKSLELKPGQFITGRRMLHSAMFPVPGDLSAPTPETCWNWLKLLEEYDCVKIDSRSRFSVVTVVNYELYQGSNEEGAE
jgi:hypothetical protein